VLLILEQMQDMRVLVKHRPVLGLGEVAIQTPPDYYLEVAKHLHNQQKNQNLGIVISLCSTCEDF
jgi:hypothetical protein